jgi:hypothetical protein
MYLFPARDNQPAEQIAVCASSPSTQESKKHAIQCGLAAQVLQLSGKLWLRAFGCSMLPSVWPGDLFLIRLAAFADLHTGQLLFYAAENGLVIHRIVEKNANRVITRGDSLPHDDAPVSPSQVLGTVALIQRGRVRFIPKGDLNCTQKLLRTLIRRSTWFRSFLLRLNALRLKWTRSQPEPQYPIV